MQLDWIVKIQIDSKHVLFFPRLRDRCTYSLPCECNNALFPFLLESEPPLLAGLLPREPVWLPGLFPREPRPPPRPFDLPHLALSRWGLGPRVGDGFFTSTIRPPAKFIIRVLTDARTNNYQIYTSKISVLKHFKTTTYIFFKIILHYLINLILFL